MNSNVCCDCSVSLLTVKQQAKFLLVYPGDSKQATSKTTILILLASISC